VSRFRAIFPAAAKPLIAMAHVPALPGTPLYDADAGLPGAVAAVRRDVDALLDFARKAPAARTAHPRTEHFAPLFVTLGAGESDLAAQCPVVEGFWGGLAKRSFQLG